MFGLFVMKPPASVPCCEYLSGMEAVIVSGASRTGTAYPQSLQRERVFLSDHGVPVFPHTLMCGQALLASVLQVEIAWRCLCVSLSFGPTGLGRCDQELHGRREKPALNFTQKPGFAFWKMHCNYCKSKKRRQKT